jgi:Outer membrane protein beta-barrel domain
MKLRRIALTCVPLLLATASAGLAQSDERFDLYGDYSYIQFNPSLTGLQSRAFNGGGGGAQFNFLHFLGLRADFQGYGSTSWTVNYSGPVVTPHGTVPAGTFVSNGNMFTYLFGPVVRVPLHRLTVYGDLLFGQSNTNGYGSLEKAIDAAGGTIQVSGTQHPFTMDVGGGLDLNLNKNIALRLGEIDYMLTRYSNPIISTNNQNSFRYLGGIVFKFGGGH